MHPPSPPTCTLLPSWHRTPLGAGSASCYTNIAIRQCHTIMSWCTICLRIFRKCYRKAVLHSGSKRFNCYGILSIVFWKYAFQDNYTRSTSLNTRSRAAQEGHILQFVHWLRQETRGDVDVVADIPYCAWGAWRCSFAWNNVCGSLVERISLLLSVFREEHIAICYISLFLGCWNIDDSLVGQWAPNEAGRD